MSTSVEALETLHRYLLSQAQGSEYEQELRALAASVPHAAPLLESLVPGCATIMRPEQIRELLTSFAISLLQAQSVSVVHGTTRAPRRARPLP